MKTKNSERIKVAVRSRPISDKEKAEGFEKYFYSYKINLIKLKDA